MPRPIREPEEPPARRPPAVVQWPTPAAQPAPAQPPPTSMAPPPARPPAPAQPPAQPPQAPPIGATPAINTPPPQVAGTAVGTPAQPPPQTAPPVFGGSAKVNSDTPIQAPPPTGNPPPVTVGDRYKPDADTGAALIQPGRDEAMYDFAQVDSSNKPSDFVGFSEFAGLNDDALRAIADRAAGESEKARSGAMGYLKAASAEANDTTPMETTVSYGKYLDAMAKAGDAAERGVTATGNPFEDALRGVYAPAQQARDNRQAGNAARVAGATASQRDTFLATQKKLAAEKAAATEARRIADAAEKKKTDALEREYLARGGGRDGDDNALAIRREADVTRRARARRNQGDY